ncbi:DNA/RNA polymerase [Clathrospora elynae]|uniref:DNA/RNA polymerase n=1 Tax=Clathrospora elynae TaxID=706981 RepID=A0A6A5STY9_9PLEO|nr:DNA/RNA polymerase [Clathrospora elynae]
MNAVRRKRLRQQLDSVIIHLDCFYASVFEHENPDLKSLPLAVQQKQIIVTCNYEARRRGLHKLQLIHEARKVCPDVVIVLGEDLGRFRNASKELYAFIRCFSWNSRCERLGFDEIFLDVSDIIDYNISILNPNHLTNSFFYLSKNDPTVGFPYDATRLTGHTYPKTDTRNLVVTSFPLHLRLALGSHLAQHIRTKLESEKGYTATVGISTNKLLAKLVGNTYKPNSQTTLLPPYTSDDGNEENDCVTSFIDDHELGKIPGVGFKIAQKLRAHLLQRPADFDARLVYGGTKEDVRVYDVRTFPGMGPETLEKVLHGPGVPQGIGAKIWGLLNGRDDTEVGQAREIPRQISIEDSYLRLDTLDGVLKELRMLAKKLLERMHTDLLQDEEDEAQVPKDATINPSATTRRWLAHPKTIRLSTRPRPPLNPGGSRGRSFARISKSAPMPTFVFNLKDHVDALVGKLVTETLLPLFRKLHPEKSGWNLSLVNVAVTNMADAASEKGGVGRDIGKMFKRQDDVLKQWRVNEEEETTEEGLTEAARILGTLDRVMDEPPAPEQETSRFGSEDVPTSSQEDSHVIADRSESEGEDVVGGDSYRCEECGAVMPMFAMGAHNRWHAQT